jgi:flagellar protein FlaJ
LFRKFAEKLAPRFPGLTDDLKKANLRFLTSTYIAIALFVSFSVLALGLIVFLILILFNLSLIKFIWIAFVLFAVSLILFYLYPGSERNSVQKRISQELPFATIHMAAIAGSNIEPSKIFEIIATSKEYKNVGKEMRKVVNQVEIYGYDLVSSLKNVAKQTSNKRLAELFHGLSTNISSGGDLKNYLEKKAENYLTDYRLERQRYSALAGTFMDIYISILIAAPLVLMMMFIIMNVAGVGIGLGINTLLAVGIGIVVLINILFLIVLQIKQPQV